MSLETASRKRPRSPSPYQSPAIYRSTPIEDRASTFVAIYSPNITAKALQANLDFKNASHRITAWRQPGKQRSLSQQPIYECGHDDDGEKYAGKKLETLLQSMGVEGAVMVARWYGGVLLGPVRFTHIENCAREAILKWKDETVRKKQHIEDKESISKLMITLEDRDESIVVLRKLLAEKQKKDAETMTTTPAKKIDYTKMPLRVLQQLEKARDKTISWILKEIDNVEALGVSSTEGGIKKVEEIDREEIGIKHEMEIGKAAEMETRRVVEMETRATAETDTNLQNNPAEVRESKRNLI